MARSEADDTRLVPYEDSMAVIRYAKLSLVRKEVQIYVLEVHKPRLRTANTLIPCP